MKIRSIEYQDFRNIENQTIEPSDNVTLFYGNNAEGKTNALEGIYMFAYGRSFRAAKEKEMVGFGKDFSRLKLTYSDHRRENVREIAISSTGKRILKHNGVVIRRLSEYAGIFRVVLFCPSHLSIVRDGPVERREFLDSAITQLNGRYLRTLQRYNSQLAGRNQIIRQRTSTDEKTFRSMIDVWSEELSKSGEIISAIRYGYTERLSKHVAQLLGEMTGSKEKPELKYSEPKSAAEYYSQLTENLDREIKAGATLFGPHREDIQITLNGRQARLYCSQGQLRSIALAMKLAEGEISEEETGEYPIVLLDDVLSELDEKRRDFVLGGMKGKQVIVTACDSAPIADRVYRVEGGRYFRTK